MRTLVAVAVIATACSAPPPRPPQLEEVSRSERLWTGVAVTPDGRMFVTFPRWFPDVPVSVAEIRAEGGVVPFPDASWNAYRFGADPARHFVCAQSIVADSEGLLWVVDAGRALERGVVPGGPKLVRIDPASATVVRVLAFDESVAPLESYLNDVRVDLRRGFAYLTDSGAGALIAVDLASGQARRVLATHPATRSEGVTLSFGGVPWLPGGQRPEVHADGLALDPSGDFLYFQALTGRTLYRVASAVLRDPALDDDALGSRVERVGTTGAADGMEFGRDGRLYLTGIEESAIKVLGPGSDATIVLQDPRLAWPDSLAVAPGGELLVTTSQIHLAEQRTEPYRILRLRL